MPVMVELPSGVAYFVNIPIAFPMLYNHALSGDMPIAMLGPMDGAVAEDYQSDDAHAWWTGKLWADGCYRQGGRRSLYVIVARHNIKYACHGHQFSYTLHTPPAWPSG